MARTPTHRSLFVALLATTVFLGACSTSGSDDASPTTSTTTGDGGPSTTTEAPPDTTDGEGTGDRQAYLDAFTEGFQDEDEQLFDARQIDCLAEGYLDTIGLDNLVDAGVTPEQYSEGDDFPEEVGLDEDKANELYDQFGACDIDLKELFFDLSPEPITDEQRSCIDDVLTDDAIRQSFVNDLLELDERQDPFEDAESCIPDPFGEDDTTEDGPTANTTDPGN